MITKSGNELVKKANIAPWLGPIGAAYEGFENLTPEEEEALKKYYELDEDASLGLRSAGRSFVGANLGALVGSLFGNGVAGVGAILGSRYGADQYSQDNAQKILRRQKGIE